jgi:hypothetical protein
MKILEPITKVLVPIATISAVTLFIRIFIIDYCIKGRSTELGPVLTLIFIVMVLSALSLAVIEIVRLVAKLIKEQRR